MKESPILFKGPLVRGILSGQKTVTRRPVKGLGLQWLEDFTPEYVADAANSLCPYGQPGDRLWVRETWYCDHFDVQQGPYLQPADMTDLDEAREKGDLVYAADGLTPYEADQPVWKPSIHMPRWVSRILLEVTDVRVDRLQGITEEQARAEGITDGGCNNCGNHEPCGCECPAPSAVDSFVHLWNSTGGDWDANPWVWVIGFKLVSTARQPAQETQRCVK